MANGILVIDKSAGWTSQDVAAKLRGVFHERRVGHGGTLDPMATGVLPIFIGRATRAAEFLESAEKEYIAGLCLGVVTDTQDTSGNILETHPVTATREAVQAALAQFLGPIEQIPPMYSAVKIGGQKLYELARKGKEIERKPRSITIHELELLEGEGTEFTLRVRCSKGTYVRTLCHDLGRSAAAGVCRLCAGHGRAALRFRRPLPCSRCWSLRRSTTRSSCSCPLTRSFRRIRRSSSRWDRLQNSKTARRSRTGNSASVLTAFTPRTANFCCLAVWKMGYLPPSRVFSR